MMGITNCVQAYGGGGDPVDKVVANNAVIGSSTLGNKVLLRKSSTKFLNYNELPVNVGNSAQDCISYQNIVGTYQTEEYVSSTTAMKIGTRGSSYFRGEVDLADTYISINNKKVGKQQLLIIRVIIRKFKRN